jgi:lipooligosaccharide transport system permease protein
MTSPTIRSLEYWLYQYKRTWRGGIITGFLSPVLFLAAMGVGLGTLVPESSPTLHGVSYLVFLAPGLLAANAMQVAVQESSYPVMGAIKWVRTYHAMLATPIRVVDLLYGHLLFIAFRVLTVSAIFLGVMVAFDTTQSWEAIFLLPAGLLTGVAFATAVVAFAATQENDTGFNAVYRFGVIPLFLFSGTFFPIGQLPIALQPIAWVTPLWQGVDLCRHLSLGTAGLWTSLGHTAYLVGVSGIGVAVARRTYRARLVT